MLKRLQNQAAIPTLWRVVKGILHSNHTSAGTEPGMCNKFASYYASKIDKARATVEQCARRIGNTLSAPQRAPETSLDLLNPTTESEVVKIIAKLPNKTSPLDFIHTSILKSCSDVLAPLITRLIHLSFSEGCFPAQFKLAQVTPLIKKAGLDTWVEPSNYSSESQIWIHSVRSSSVLVFHVCCVPFLSICFTNLGRHFIVRCQPEFHQYADAHANYTQPVKSNTDTQEASKI